MRVLRINPFQKLLRNQKISFDIEIRLIDIIFGILSKKERAKTPAHAVQFNVF